MSWVRFLGVALASWGAAMGAASGASAQTASSPTYFIAGAESSHGGTASSATYALEASFGASIVGERADSTTYRVLGGFRAVTTVSVANRPWVSGVRSPFAPISGLTTHTVHGHQLDLGSSTSVTIGGLPATVTSRQTDRLTITAPAFTRPGWQSLVATNAGGSATLTRALGVYPMADTWPTAIESTQPFTLIYRGRPGDLVLFVVASRRLAVPRSIPPYGHVLELDLAAIIGDPVGPFVVRDPSGVLAFPFPGVGFMRPLYVQMIGVSTTAPYAPGSLTNVIAL